MKYNVESRNIMKILALDTATVVATVAIADEEKLYSETTIHSKKKNHSERLMLLIEEVLKNSGLELKDVDLFSCTVGPGSFTGLRIAIATVKGLAQSLNKPVIPLSTLEALAYNLSFCKEIICPIIDAQRDQVYTCFYEWTEEGLQALTQESVYSIEELLNIITGQGKGVVLLGDGVKKIPYEALEKYKDLLKVAPVSSRMPKASSLASLSLDVAKKGVTTTYSNLEPNYMRKSQAEIQMELKKNNS